MKKIIYILPFFLVFFVFAQVKAADASKVDEYAPNLHPTSDVDGIGRRVNGSWVYKYRSLIDGFFKNVDVAECVSLTTGDEGAYMYIVKTPEGKLPNGGYTFDTYSLYGNGTVTFSAYQYSYGDRENDGYQGDTFWLNGQVITLSDYSPGTGADTRGVTFVSPDVYENQKFITSLPIFKADDMDSINAYIQNGDVSGAENVTDLAEEDETVELPVGLKVTGGYAQGIESAYNLDKDCVFHWTQSVDTSDYVYDVDCKLTINMLNKNIGSSSQTSEYYSSGWIDFHEKSYDGANAITCKVSEEDLNDKLIEAVLQAYVSKNGQKLPYKGYVISSLEIRVRNVCGSKASDFVVIKIDKDGNSTTATVQDENGDTVSNDEYDGSDVADKENSVDTDLSDFVDILNFIRNGFGLFGNNGLIAMFRSFFSFLPDTWWTLILLGMGLIIVVGIINFLLKR